MLADRDADSSLDEAERIVAQPLLRETARELPQEEKPPASDTQRDAPRESLRRPWVRRMLFLLLPLALIAGSAWYVVGGRVMYTDDAYVNANQVGISTDVAGTGPRSMCMTTRKSPPARSSTAWTHCSSRSRWPMRRLTGRRLPLPSSR